MDRKKVNVKILLQVLVQEIHNNMVCPSEEGVLKEPRNEKDNIIISETLV